MRTGKVVLGVVGSLLMVVALAMIVGGTVLLAATGLQRTPAGFMTSPTIEVSTDSYALTSTRLDLGAVRNDWLPTGWLATIQVVASSRGQAPVFIGIGPVDDVADYLEGVAHDEVTRISGGDVTYQTHEGAAVPALPSDQGFWVASTEGPGSEALVWDIEPGQWNVLIMNADATPDVAVDVSAGTKSPWLTVAIVVLWLGGFLCAAVGAVMLVFAFRRRRTVAAVVAGQTAPTEVAVSTGSRHDGPWDRDPHEGRYVMGGRSTVSAQVSTFSRAGEASLTSSSPGW